MEVVCWMSERATPRLTVTVNGSPQSTSHRLGVDLVGGSDVLH